MKYYKAMSRNYECRGVKFEEGGVYEVEGSPVLCKNGYHFCSEIAQTLLYYPVTNDALENRYAEIEILGDAVFEMPERQKGVTNKIKIARIIPDDEIKNLFDKNWNTGFWNTGNRNTGNQNTGNWNTGFWNTGNRNTGNQNTGDWNTGFWNTGNQNTGNWNTGNWNTGNRNTGNWNTGNQNTGNWNSCCNETGFFNSEERKTIRVFNKECPIDKWTSAEKPGFLYFNIDQELGYKGSFKKSFDKNATKSDIDLLKALPNFDADVFFEISGIRLEDDDEAQR